MNYKLSDYSGISASDLAYIGDAVFEILVREKLIFHREGTEHPSTYSLRYVTAKSQSDAFSKIENILGEDELEAFKRGRNCVHGAIPKHATAVQYRRATGFEALMGYLWINGRFDRAGELFDIAFSEDTDEGV